LPEGAGEHDYERNSSWEVLCPGFGRHDMTVVGGVSALEMWPRSERIGQQKKKKKKNPSPRPERGQRSRRCDIASCAPVRRTPAVPAKTGTRMLGQGLRRISGPARPVAGRRTGAARRPHRSGRTPGARWVPWPSVTRPAARPSAPSESCSAQRPPQAPNSPGAWRAPQPRPAAPKENAWQAPSSHHDPLPPDFLRETVGSSG